METGIFLVNGISIPYHVIDHAMQWAADHHAVLRGVFIFGDEERSEEYGFPSDIEQAETLSSESEAEQDLEQLIANNLKYAKKQAETKGIRFEGEYMKDPSETDLLNILQGASLLFADPRSFDDPSAFANTPYNFDAIRSLAPIRVVEVLRDAE